jgi:hypothetical protein
VARWPEEAPWEEPRWVGGSRRRRGGSGGCVGTDGGGGLKQLGF